METNWVRLGCIFINLKKSKNISNSTHAHPYLGENYFIHYLQAIDTSQLVGSTHPLITHVVRHWLHATVMQYTSHPQEPEYPCLGNLVRTLQVHAPYSYSSRKKDPQNLVTLLQAILVLIPLVEERTPQETLQLSNQYSIYGHDVFNPKA